MTITHNLFSATFTPSGGSAIDLISKLTLEESDEGNTTLLMTDAARTITAAYRDAIYKVLVLALTDEEFNNRSEFEQGKIGKLVVVKKRKNNGGDLSGVRQITETFDNVMIAGVSTGTSNQGNATVNMTFIAFDPNGVAVKKYTIAS